MVTEPRHWRDVPDEARAVFCRRFLEEATAPLEATVRRRGDAVVCAGNLQGRDVRISVDVDLGMANLRLAMQNTLGVVVLHLEQPDENEDEDDSSVDERTPVSRGVFLEEPPSDAAAMQRTLAALGPLQFEELADLTRNHRFGWLGVDSDHLAVDYADTIVDLPSSRPLESLSRLITVATWFEGGTQAVAPRPRVFVAGRPVSLEGLRGVGPCPRCGQAVPVGLDGHCADCGAPIDLASP